MNHQANTAEDKKIPLGQKVGTFDQVVYERDYERASQQLLDILLVLENGKEGFGASTVDTSELVERQATVLCAAVTRLLADKDYLLTQKLFIRLAHLKRPLMQAFEISGYKGTGHLLQCIGTVQEGGGRSLTKNEIAKLFFGLSINAMTPELLGLLKRQPREISWFIVCGFLSEQIVWTAAAKTARAEILTWADHFIGMPVDFDTVRNIGPSYMGCSYDESAHKHDIKRAMNDLVRRWALSVGCTDIDMSQPRRAVKKRPTIVIFAELYDSKHAMHRCYGPSIQSLRKRFKVIFMPISGKCDVELEYMFDKVDKLGFTTSNPKPFIDKVKSYRPDIVYFPSVGMRFASIVASNIRMAPIQIFTPGHPATTHSDQLDYLILMEGCVGELTCYSETVFARESKPYFEMRADAKAIDPQIRINPETLKVAVPAWSRKVTPGFLQVCEILQQRAARNIEFYFFPNGVGGLFQSFSRRTKTVVNAKVFPRTNYNEYIERLNECDIFLSTFPFGATNSLVDAAIQGLPVVNLKGPEAHAMNDSDILKNVAQPDWLSAETVNDFIAAALRLINDDQERVAISRAILKSEPKNHFLVEDTSDMDDFYEIFSKIYFEHEDLVGSQHQPLMLV